jgi:hypothetical protein
VQFFGPLFTDFVTMAISPRLVIVLSGYIIFFFRRQCVDTAARMAHRFFSGLRLFGLFLSSVINYGVYDACLRVFCVRRNASGFSLPPA